MSQPRIGADQFDNSVATFTDLEGIEDRFDGMAVYVRDDDVTYTWDAPTNAWILPTISTSQIEGYVPSNGADYNIDGGRADSVYTANQKINGGGA